MVEKNESVANHFVMDWAESTKWVEKPGDSPRKGEGWCQKENVNEKHQQMKNNNNSKMKINISKTSRGSPKQVLLLGVFDYFMAIVIILWLFMIICYYKIFITIIFIIIY